MPEPIDATDLAGFFSTDDWAYQATYTPPSGSPVACVVLLDPGVEQIDGQASAIRGTHTIRVRSSEVPAPKKDGVFAVATVPASSYRVDRVVEDDGLVVSVEVGKV